MGGSKCGAVVGRRITVQPRQSGKAILPEEVSPQHAFGSSGLLNVGLALPPSCSAVCCSVAASSCCKKRLKEML